MGAYIPALIWVISAIICSFIAKKRIVKATLFRQIVVVLKSGAQNIHGLNSTDLR